MLEAHLDAWARKGVAAGLRPLDERDRVLEVRLEVAPLRGREPLEAIQVEVGDVLLTPIAMTDRERRARHGRCDPEGSAGASDERRLARTELAGDGDDVTRSEPWREPACDRLGLRWTGAFPEDQTKAVTIYISRKDDVARMDEFVGPKA